MLTPDQIENSKSISYDVLTNNFEMVFDKLKRFNPEGILFFGKARFSSELIEKVSSSFPELPLFANQELIDNSSRFHSLPAGLSLPMPKDKLSATFIDSFLKENKYQPGFVAGFAYDALNVLAVAIKAYGTDFDQLKKAISLTDITGVTGALRFDEHGNRDTEVTIGRVEDLLGR